MSFVLPSFFKIRVVALVLGFFLLFFFVGFVRWCFGADALCIANGQCTVSLATVVEQTSNGAGYWDTVVDLGVDCDPIVQNPINVIYPAVGDKYYQINYNKYYWNGSIWIFYTTITTTASTITPSSVADFVTLTNESISFLAPNGCSDLPLSCPDPIAEQSFLDTCPLNLGTYNCLEPAASQCLLQNCSDIQQTDIETYCSVQGVDVSAGSGNNVNLTCNDDGTQITDITVDCVDCALLKSSWANTNCNGLSNLSDYNCETNTGTCKDYTCNDLLAQCYDKCGGSVNNFSCTESSTTTPSVSVPCDCLSTSPDINSGISADDNPPGQAADIITPESTTTDPNSKITADNTKLIADSVGKDLPAIDKSIQANGAKLDTINDSLGDIKNELSSIDADLSGTYNKQNIINNYTVDPSLNTFGQFDTRFGTFVSDLKATPLFSLPNQVLFNIPNSTESSYTIDMGQYGQASIDLSDYATPLLILRSAFLLCFSYAGLRIVVSKK